MAEAGWIFLDVLVVGFCAWTMVLVIQNERRDRRFWREWRARQAQHLPRPNVRRGWG